MIFCKFLLTGSCIKNYPNICGFSPFQMEKCVEFEPAKDILRTKEEMEKKF
jgi:hypothetical protein